MMKIKTRDKWLGEVINCDVCDRDLNKLEFFYDARTKQGWWGLLCKDCFKLHGVGLGVGRGQQYNTETRVKMAG